LLDLGGLAAQAPEVVQLGASYITPALDLDVVDDRTVERKGALDTHPEADFPDGEGLLDSRPRASDHHTGEDLDAGPVALDHLHVHLHRVTGSEGGDVVAKRACVEFGDELAHEV